MAPRGNTTIAKLTVSELIACIGSDDVSPGSGSAGAVALALAAACAAKAASISLKHRPAAPDLQRALQSFTRIAQLALADADRDAEAFAGFIRAKSAEAADRLVREGERVADLIAALLAAIEDIETTVHGSMIGDLNAAKALIGAARSIQQRNESEASCSS